MKYFAMLIKPASGNCNLNCKYCFYHDVMKYQSEVNVDIMTNKTTDSVIDKTINFFKEEITITYAFQGGEPTMAGIDYFRYFINKVNKSKKTYHHINYAIQTNGTLLNNDWYQLFKDNKFLVGLSLDGIKEVNNKYRIQINGKPTFDIIMNKYKELTQRNIDVNILTVLTSELSKYPEELFKFYKNNKINYIQLIPCLPRFGTEHDEFSLRPKQFADFYNKFFRLWYEQLKKGNYIHVTHFDNLIPIFRGIPPQQCGYLGKCSMQFVTEADGSVYPCDFYVTDEYKAGNINTNTLQQLANSTNVSTFLNQPRRTSNLCKTCKYKPICNSQCKRMNFNYFTENYCGYKEFIDENLNELWKIAKSF